MNIRILLLVFILIQCSDNKKGDIKTHKIDKFILYELECEGKVYFSFDKGSCIELPKSYFSPIGDSEYYYTISFRVKNGELELYSFYNNLTKRGEIDKLLKIKEYKDYRDNVFVNDSLIGKKNIYTISGSTVRW